MLNASVARCGCRHYFYTRTTASGGPPVNLGRGQCTDHSNLCRVQYFFFFFLVQPNNSCIVSE